MEITDVRMDIVDNSGGKLRAFCSLTLNEQFVIKNFKILEGNHGLFVAMPSRKLTKPCYNCDNRVFRRANYCDRCGNEFDERSGNAHHDSGESHSDIAFPIEDDFREELEDKLIDSYRARMEGGSGVNVEHHKDENYDLLDFDYGGHLEDNSDAKSDQERSEQEETFDTGDEDDAGESMTQDVFSEPSQPLQKRDSTPSTDWAPSSVLSSSGTEQSEEEKEQKQLY